MIANIIFLLCISLLSYSYLLYPLILSLLFRLSAKKNHQYTSSLKRVFILIAAHNEASVITRKLESINSNSYPAEKLFIYLGSDNSTDKTNQLVKDFQAESKYEICFQIMEKRSGKIGTINTLYRSIMNTHNITSEDVFILTDADVMLQADTIQKLVRHFSDPKVGVVDSHIINELDETKNVSKSESKYLNRELRLKYYEGQVFGKLMGTFGGCFAIRSTCFKTIPEHFKVDDFYLTMNALANGYQAISDPEARCTGKVLSTFSEEFKRKRRMSSGNFQNMAVYKKYLLPISSLGFIFFSHKVIRYIGPFLMLGMLLTSAYLAYHGSVFMQYLLLGQVLWYLIIPILDKLCAKLGLNLLALRNVSYFNYMNLALLLGFKDYINGIESNIWEPTKRS